MVILISFFLYNTDQPNAHILWGSSKTGTRYYMGWSQVAIREGPELKERYISEHYCS